MWVKKFKRALSSIGVIMRSDKIKLAKKLRLEGMSLRGIARKLSCSRNSVSRWIQDIPLSNELIQKIKDKDDKIRAKAANHPNSPREKNKRIRDRIIHSSEKEIPYLLSPNMLKLIGVSLYWAEGSKAGRNNVAFSNSDPTMIKIMMRFFREICNVPETKFRGELNIHPHLNAEKAELYWSKITRVPLGQFHKTQKVSSRSSLGKRETLPLGTFKIVISSTELLCRIKGWIKGFEKWALSSTGGAPLLQSGGQWFEPTSAHLLI